ncbi:hypothetical protein TorRG33x02_283240 [Trema orientale]|uniref:Uncharacterized protein n=1 Tax=Trema orientale TaxID=63057 RepID=A0A2P5CJ30_TREOI|nr:hypothetical protein TorRG33x02_283240 [Trema orientale]
MVVEGEVDDLNELVSYQLILPFYLTGFGGGGADFPSLPFRLLQMVLLPPEQCAIQSPPVTTTNIKCMGGGQIEEGSDDERRSGNGGDDRRMALTLSSALVICERE